jgi:hypothetical protein
VGDDRDPPEHEHEHEHEHESILDELRHMPVGVNDPNIIGDAGPLDIPPGSDPHDPGEFTGDDDEVDAEG